MYVNLGEVHTLICSKVGFSVSVKTLMFKIDYVKPFNDYYTANDHYTDSVDKYRLFSNDSSLFRSILTSQSICPSKP